MAGSEATAGSEAMAGELELIEPMPGFDGEQSFVLTPIDDNGVLLSMRSARTPALRFVLTAAEAFFDDYRPAVGQEVAATLGAATVEQLRVLLVLSIPTGLADATANTRAPIVLDPDAGRAVQVVLDDESLSMQRPLLAPAG